MWKNITSYSKSDDKSEVRTTQLKLDGLDLTVTRHIHYGKELIMRCENVGIDKKGLNTECMEDGQKMALYIVESRLKKMLYAVDQVKY